MEPPKLCRNHGLPVDHDFAKLKLGDELQSTFHPLHYYTYCRSPFGRCSPANMEIGRPIHVDIRAGVLMLAPKDMRHTSLRLGEYTGVTKGES